MKVICKYSLILKICKIHEIIYVGAVETRSGDMTGYIGERL